MGHTQEQTFHRGQPGLLPPCHLLLTLFLGSSQSGQFPHCIFVVIKGEVKPFRGGQVKTLFLALNPCPPWPEQNTRRQCWHGDVSCFARQSVGYCSAAGAGWLPPRSFSVALPQGSFYLGLGYLCWLPWGSIQLEVGTMMVTVIILLSTFTSCRDYNDFHTTFIKGFGFFDFFMVPLFTHHSVCKFLKILLSYYTYKNVYLSPDILPC